ncbi:MAG: SDR family NAD(P)-dependent oxidoreductase, partial [candidate division KSB1 bacterium]|nr:SDR family NAD(P)-dependent oxidoreductase [candidate division KSB1 bacterium]
MSDVHPVALITGAGSGIGRGIAIELAKNGFHIAGNDIVSDPQNRERGLWEVKDRVEELGVSFLPVQGDISSQKDHEKIVDAVANEFGTIHWLVNNAGVAPKQRFDILETTSESYDRLMHINARGPFFLTQRVANHMIEASKKDSDARFGIIFIS